MVNAWYCCMDKSGMNILQNIIFCVPPNKESHLGLDQHKYIMSGLSSCVKVLAR